MSLTDVAILDPLTRCTKASILIYAGQYEEAKGVLGDLFRGVGEHPDIERHPSDVGAEILLQCACLSGFLGDAQGADVHDRVKDLLTEAVDMFRAQNLESKVSEGNYELGICYYRKGAYDEARIMFDEAMISATSEIRGKIVIGRTIVEFLTGHCEKARDILIEAKSFFDTASDALKGRWHGHMGLVQRGLARGRSEYLDLAIIEYTAAIYHYELAGHLRYSGRNLNNLAFLLYKLGRYARHTIS